MNNTFLKKKKYHGVDGEEEEDCGATTQVGVGNECADERGEEAGARPRRHVPGGDDIALPDHAGEVAHQVPRDAGERQAVAQLRPQDQQARPPAAAAAVVVLATGVRPPEMKQ